MGFCLSHASAAAFWSWTSRVEGRARSRQREERAAASEWTHITQIPSSASSRFLASPRLTTCSSLKPAISASFIRSFASLHDIPTPIHILVSDQAFRQKKGITCCHALTAAPPTAEFFAIDEDIDCPSPALSLLQLGRELDMVSWLTLAMEFCGSYTLDSSAAAGYVERAALTSVSELEQMASSLEGMKGIKTVRRALQWLSDNAPSPRSTGFALALCLPRKMGGFGLEKPLFNAAVPLDEKAQAVYGKSTCTCSLYLPEAKVAVEIVGTRVPSADDALRASALAFQDVETLILRPEDLATYEGLQQAAARIAKHAGKRFTAPESEATSRALIARLMGQQRHPWE